MYSLNRNIYCFMVSWPQWNTLKSYGFRQSILETNTLRANKHASWNAWVILEIGYDSNIKLNMAAFLPKYRSWNHINYNVRTTRDIRKKKFQYNSGINTCEVDSGWTWNPIQHIECWKLKNPWFYNINERT